MIEKTLEVQNYESNLKMHYEAKRRELEMLVTSSMPNQLSNIKTLLWFNVASIALLFKYFSTIDTFQKAYLLIVGAAVVLLIFSMLIAREKDYGTPEDVTLASTYESTKWTHSQFSLDLLATTQSAILFNRKMVLKRARLMNLATLFTFVSTIYLILLVFNT